MTKHPPRPKWDAMKTSIRAQFGNEHDRVMHNLCKPKWAFPEHIHDDMCDIDYVVKGTVQHIINGQNQACGPGDLIWIRQADRHTLSSEAGCECYNLNVSQNAMATAFQAMGLDRAFASLREQTAAPTSSIPDGRRDWYEQTLAALVRSRGQSEDICLFWRFLTTAFLECLLRDRDQEPETDTPIWLRQALRIINERLEDPVHLSDLPDICGRSREHVARSFRRYLQRSPSDYLNEQRLERAALLLQHSTRNITDICYSVGFNAPSYFYRLFTHRFGKPPSELRRTTAHQAVLTNRTG